LRRLVAWRINAAMVKRNRIILALGAAALLLISLAPDRRADIAIQMHRGGDIAPHKVEATVDLGIMAISVLVTWSKRLVY
jgi:hypothetical protein